MTVTLIISEKSAVVTLTLGTWRRDLVLGDKGRSRPKALCATQPSNGVCHTMLDNADNPIIVNEAIIRSKLCRPNWGTFPHNTENKPSFLTFYFSYGVRMQLIIYFHYYILRHWCSIKNVRNECYELGRGEALNLPHQLITDIHKYMYWIFYWYGINHLLSPEPQFSTVNMSLNLHLNFVTKHENFTQAMLTKHKTATPTTIARSAFVWSNEIKCTFIVPVCPFPSNLIRFFNIWCVLPQFHQICYHCGIFSLVYFRPSIGSNSAFPFNSNGAWYLQSSTNIQRFKAMCS